jgi:hypothetical protein
MPIDRLRSSLCNPQLIEIDPVVEGGALDERESRRVSVSCDFFLVHPGVIILFLKYDEEGVRLHVFFQIAEPGDLFRVSKDRKVILQPGHIHLTDPEVAFFGVGRRFRI